MAMAIYSYNRLDMEFFPVKMRVRITDISFLFALN